MTPRADSPREAQLDPDVRRRLERLATLLRFAPSARGTSAGRDRGGRLGRAGEFEEFRPWRPGDELRALDVRVYRRLGRRVTRVDREDSASPLTLLVDRSLSMADPARERATRELAIFFLAVARARGEPCRVFFTTDRTLIPIAEKDPGTIEAAFDRVPPSGVADFTHALHSVPRSSLGPGRLVWLTDGFGIDALPPLAPAFEHGRVLLLAPWTREEWRPTPLGAVTLRSREGETEWSGAITPALVREYTARNTRRWQRLASTFRERGGDALRVVAEAGAIGAIDACLERGGWLTR